MKKLKMLILALVMATLAVIPSACGKETVTIWTSTEEYNIEFMQKKLGERFPDYNIQIVYDSTSNIATKIINEGENSECDLVFQEEYAYLENMISKGVLDSIEGDYDLSKYEPDTITDELKNYVLPNIRSGGAIIINNYVLEQHGLEKPTSYNDLLNSAYRGLVSMASPKSSGTGYMFYYSLVKAWEEEPALTYFNNLAPNVLQFTTSGSGPVNALVNREVAVGFGMISQAVNKINGGNTELEILFFEEGAPFNLYGNAIVKGKKARKAVKDVMDYMDSYLTDASSKEYYPEPVIKGADYEVQNFPKNINYANMEGNTYSKKADLLAKWTH